MRALVVGAAGQLGTDLVAALHTAGHETRAVTRTDVDVRDRQLVDDFVAVWSRRGDAAEPRVVFNCAAYTDVDGAEADEAAAHLANAVGPAYLAMACAAHSAELVHVSTDYVFPGDADRPYEVDDETGPRSVYGRTKLAGEQAVRALAPASYVVRTAWLYGAAGGNFVRTIARLEGERDTIRVVDDQRGSPTWSVDLAAALVALPATGRHGVYHCTGGGETTWHGFAQAVFEELGADPARVHRCSTEEFPRPAPRPAYSVLSNAALVAAGVPAPRPWRDALRAAFEAAGDDLRRPLP